MRQDLKLFKLEKLVLSAGKLSHSIFLRPRKPARSATIRYNRIAQWKRKEISGIWSYLELPRRTDGRLCTESNLFDRTNSWQRWQVEPVLHHRRRTSVIKDTVL